MGIALMEPATARLGGLERRAHSHRVPTTAMSKGTVKMESASAIRTTQALTVPFDNAPTAALVLESVST